MGGGGDATPLTPASSSRPPPPPLYRTPAGEQAIRKLYDEALAALPYPHEETTVPTSWGQARVTAAGPKDATPLILWHGMGAPGPIMLPILNPLIATSMYRVYCPDIPYHAGSRSEDAHLLPEGHEHGHWCLEVMRGLGLAKPSKEGSGPSSAAGRAAPESAPFHVGVSFGAAVLMDLAAVAPETIRAAVMFVPAGLMPGQGLTILFKLVLPSMLFRLLPCKWTAWLALRGMVDEPWDDKLDFVLLGWLHVAQWAQLPGGHTGFTVGQLAGYSSPTFVIAAEHDVFWPGKMATAAAERLMPGCRTVVISGAKHLPAKHICKDFNGWVLDFFADAAAGKAERVGAAAE